MSEQDGKSNIVEIRNKLGFLKRTLANSIGRQVYAGSVKDAAKDSVQFYFNQARPTFLNDGLDEDSLVGLDKWFQELLILTQKAAIRKAYEQIIKSANQELNGVELSLVTAKNSCGRKECVKLDGKENRISQTLSLLVPSAGLSYEQACFDLRDSSRRSYRGAAAELRESLREALDCLAPDKDVMEQPNFKLEKDRQKPTMKQKVRYILSSRGKNKTVTEAPEDAVNIVEEMVGALARSVYNRSSVSTHVGTTKQEVQQIKAYVDVVLGELLEIT